MPPFEIQVFSPSRRMRSLPSAVADSAIWATSEPASGSVSAKAAIVRPARTPGRMRLLELVGRGKRDRAGAQALHGEGEVGEPVIASQRLADQAERADVEACRPRARHSEETGVAERGDEAAAAAVDIVMVDEPGDVGWQPRRRSPRRARDGGLRRTASEESSGQSLGASLQIASAGVSRRCAL